MAKIEGQSIYKAGITLAAASFVSHMILVIYNNEIYGEYFLLSTLLQYFIVLVLLVLGLLLCRKVGFIFPLSKNSLSSSKRSILISAVAGLFLGFCSFIIIFLSPEYVNHIQANAVDSPAISTLILLSLQAGINEEIIFRLFGMSFIVWLLMKVFRRGTSSNLLIILSIFISGMFFAYIHIWNIPQAISVELIIISFVTNNVGTFYIWNSVLEERDRIRNDCACTYGHNITRLSIFLFIRTHARPIPDRNLMSAGCREH